MPPEVRWGLGCLVGGLALGGTLILVLIVALIVQPPPWLQVVLGVALAAGATSFAWLFSSALRRGDERRRQAASNAGRGSSPSAPQEVPPPKG
jgi:hypothetical protein